MRPSRAVSSCAQPRPKLSVWDAAWDAQQTRPPPGRRVSYATDPRPTSASDHTGRGPHRDPTPSSSSSGATSTTAQNKRRNTKNNYSRFSIIQHLVAQGRYDELLPATDGLSRKELRQLAGLLGNRRKSVDIPAAVSLDLLRDAVLPGLGIRLVGEDHTKQLAALPEIVPERATVEGSCTSETSTNNRNRPGTSAGDTGPGSGKLVMSIEELSLVLHLLVKHRIFSPSAAKLLTRIPWPGHPDSLDVGRIVNFVAVFPDKVSLGRFWDGFAARVRLSSLSEVAVLGVLHALVRCGQRVPAFRKHYRASPDLLKAAAVGAATGSREWAAGVGGGAGGGEVFLANVLREVLARAPVFSLRMLAQAFADLHRLDLIAPTLTLPRPGSAEDVFGAVPLLSTAEGGDVDAKTAASSKKNRKKQLPSISPSATAEEKRKAAMRDLFSANSPVLDVLNQHVRRALKDHVESTNNQKGTLQRDVVSLLVTYAKLPKALRTDYSVALMARISTHVRPLQLSPLELCDFLRALSTLTVQKSRLDHFQFGVNRTDRIMLSALHVALPKLSVDKLAGGVVWELCKPQMGFLRTHMLSKIVARIMDSGGRSGGSAGNRQRSAAGFLTADSIAKLPVVLLRCAEARKTKTPPLLHNKQLAQFCYFLEANFLQTTQQRRVPLDAGGESALLPTSMSLPARSVAPRLDGSFPDEDHSGFVSPFSVATAVQGFLGSGMAVSPSPELLERLYRLIEKAAPHLQTQHLISVAASLRQRPLILPDGGPGLPCFHEALREDLEASLAPPLAKTTTVSSSSIRSGSGKTTSPNTMNRGEPSRRQKDHTAMEGPPRGDHDRASPAESTTAWGAWTPRLVCGVLTSSAFGADAQFADAARRYFEAHASRFSATESVAMLRNLQKTLPPSTTLPWRGLSAKVKRQPCSLAEIADLALQVGDRRSCRKLGALLREKLQRLSAVCSASSSARVDFAEVAHVAHRWGEIESRNVELFSLLAGRVQFLWEDAGGALFPGDGFAAAAASLEAKFVGPERLVDRTGGLGSSPGAVRIGGTLEAVQSEVQEGSTAPAAGEAAGDLRHPLQQDPATRDPGDDGAPEDHAARAQRLEALSKFLYSFAKMDLFHENPAAIRAVLLQLRTELFRDESSRADVSDAPVVGSGGRRSGRLKNSLLAALSSSGGTSRVETGSSSSVEAKISLPADLELSAAVRLAVAGAVLGTSTTLPGQLAALESSSGCATASASSFATQLQGLTLAALDHCLSQSLENQMWTRSLR